MICHRPERQGRFLRPLLSGLLLAGCLTAQAVEIDHSTSRYETAQTFKRISEYFTGRENTGNRMILRTNPQVRPGYYFIFSLDESMQALPEGSIALMGVIWPGNPKPVEYALFLPIPRENKKELWFGLTGNANPGQTAQPVAWKISLLSPDGSTLVERKSFLWEQP